SAWTPRNCSKPNTRRKASRACSSSATTDPMRRAVPDRAHVRNRLPREYPRDLRRPRAPLACAPRGPAFMRPAHKQGKGKPAMKKFALIAFASAAALGLAACGESNDASEDAMADNVEMPAEDAMADAALPTADADAMSDAAEDAAVDAADTAADTATEAADAAEEAAADAAAAAEAATQA